jgi:cytoskeletal protein RodZ
MKQELVEALRKEGMFAPAPKGARAQKPVERRDKNNGETTSSTTAPMGQKGTTNMTAPATTNPAVGGTKAATKTATKAAKATGQRAPQIIVMGTEEQKIFSGHRLGGLAVNTLVVVGTTAAAVGAGYAVFRVITK